MKVRRLNPLDRTTRKTFLSLIGEMGFCYLKTTELTKKEVHERENIVLVFGAFDSDGISIINRDGQLLTRAYTWRDAYKIVRHGSRAIAWTPPTLQETAIIKDRNQSA